MKISVVKMLGKDENKAENGRLSRRGKGVQVAHPGGPQEGSNKGFSAVLMRFRAEFRNS
jgi:hypothetical protein